MFNFIVSYFCDIGVSSVALITNQRVAQFGLDWTFLSSSLVFPPPLYFSSLSPLLSLPLQSNTGDKP